MCSLHIRPVDDLLPGANSSFAQQTSTASNMLGPIIDHFYTTLEILRYNSSFMPSLLSGLCACHNYWLSSTTVRGMMLVTPTKQPNIVISARCPERPTIPAGRPRTAQKNRLLPEAHLVGVRTSGVPHPHHSSPSDPCCAPRCLARWKPELPMLEWHIGQAVATLIKFWDAPL